MALDPAALDRLRSAILADPALEKRLGAIEDNAVFALSSAEAAQALGIALTPGDATEALKMDVLGLLPPPAPPFFLRRWPPVDWLPIRMAQLPESGVVVEWAYFAERRLRDPFFETSVWHAARHPLSRLLRCRTGLDDFLRGAEEAAVPAPDGLVYHCSRCGSTLVAQMLAQPASHLVVSEAMPLDFMVQLATLRRDLPLALRASFLVAMVKALTRWRAAGAEHAFVKLDCWHTFELPLFRAAFPDVPWIFLHREPIEVLVSQMRQRGVQTIPGVIASIAAHVPLEEPLGEAVNGADYCARVLGRIDAAAVEHFALGGGLIVNYAELPDAMFARILPHFGIAADEETRAAMRAAVRWDAKAPSFEFASDRAAKRDAATDEVRAAASRHMAGPYAALEALEALEARERGAGV